MKTIEELLIMFSEVLDKKGYLNVKGINETNHTPHQFMIGPKHIEYASDHSNGMLGEDTLKAIKCASPKCGLSYEEHKSDKVLFLQLTQDLKETDAQNELVKIQQLLIDNNVDGVAFVDSEEKYEFIKK